MGSVFYAFKAPITSARVVQVHEGRSDINIFIKGQMAGHIICKPDEVDPVFRMLINEDNPVAFTRFEGIDYGMEIDVKRECDWYITDGRRVTTLQELKELVKASRQAHAAMRERGLNIQESEGEKPNA